MGQTQDHLVPIAKAEDSGEQKIPSAREQIERGEEPEKIAYVRVIALVPGDKESNGSGEKVHQCAGGIDPSIGVQAGEMVTGELCDNVAPEPGGETMADTFMEQGRRRGGDHSHADDGGFIMLPGHGRLRYRRLRRFIRLRRQRGLVPGSSASKIFRHSLHSI